MANFNKDAAKIILQCFKDDKISEDETLTLLEAINNETCGGSVITYPYYPTYPTTTPWISYETTCKANIDENGKP